MLPSEFLKAKRVSSALGGGLVKRFTSRCLSMILQRRKSEWKKCTSDRFALLLSGETRQLRQWKGRGRVETHAVVAMRSFSFLYSVYLP